MASPIRELRDALPGCAIQFQRCPSQVAVRDNRFRLVMRTRSASHIAWAHRAFPTAARLAPSWFDGHVDTAVHRLDSTHKGLKADIATLAGLQLGDHRLLDVEFRSELTLRQSARVSQVDEGLFDPHRLQLRLDGSRKIWVVLRALVDLSEGASGEWHRLVALLLRLLELDVYSAL
jgi:hypothetical protein